LTVHTSDSASWPYSFHLAVFCFLCSHLKAVKTYSPLFIKFCANKYDLPVTSKALKRRAKERLAAVKRKPRKMALAPPERLNRLKEEWRENLNLAVRCRECKEDPPNIVEEFSSGDLVCGSCGLILGDKIIDTRSEWRTFATDDGNNDDPSRVGEAANPLLNGNQLETTVSFDGGAKARDLNRAQNRNNTNKGDRQLLEAYKQIGSLCDAWSMSKIVADTAKHLYKLVHDKNAFRGKSNEVVISGCIFISCRQNNVPRTFREIFALTRVSKREIGRIFKQLEKFFAEQYRNKENEGGPIGYPTINSVEYQNTTSTKAVELCIRYCSQLGLPTQTTRISQLLAEKINSVGSLAGRSPLSAAAACIFFASHLMKTPKTPKEISNVAGVSDGTIRTSYKLLQAEKDKLVDPEWIKDGKGDMKLLPSA